MNDLNKMARELLTAEYERDRPGSDTAARLRGGLSGQLSTAATVALAAIRAALLTAPPGYVLVPAELPVEMEVAFCEQWFSKRRAIDDPRMQDCWAAMITAAPEPEA